MILFMIITSDIANRLLFTITRTKMRARLQQMRAEYVASRRLLSLNNTFRLSIKLHQTEYI